VKRKDDYVLGTHDEEIARLGLQHRVWRPLAVETWRRAGFGAGQHLLDVGCGPGYASLDLADLVGAEGRVTAIDQSRRFLDYLESAARARGVDNVIMPAERDLDDPQAVHIPELNDPFASRREVNCSGPILDVTFDGAWARWVFAFVRDPRSLLVHLRDRLRPGGTIATHEYFDYATWGTAPQSAELTEFVEAVIDRWRKTGGEPNVARSLPRWLEELGFTITHLRPILEIVEPADPKWAWLMAFIESGRRRLATLGDLSQAQSLAIGEAAASWGVERPPVRMITPAVLEIVAVRR
jgi:SAM-dependent methyltransferase